MKLKLNKKKLKNLSKDAQILPGKITPNVAGGSYECDTGTNPGTWPMPSLDGCLPVGGTDTCMTVDWTCDATGSCGCDSAGGHCTVTNTCR